MKIVLPVAESGKWEIENLIIFDTCIYCGKEREKASMGRFLINGRWRKCYTGECQCTDTVDLYSAVEENNLIEIINDLNIDDNQSRK